MRKITSFLVTKTNKPYPEVQADGVKRGFIYPAPHVYAYKFEPLNENEDWKHIRGRPVASNCALVRDNNIARNSIGIMIYCMDNEEVHPDAMRLVANMIKLFSDDLGIEQYSVVTDHEDDSRTVDVLQLNSMISTSPSVFNKRI